MFGYSQIWIDEDVAQTRLRFHGVRQRSTYFREPFLEFRVIHEPVLKQGLVARENRRVD